MKTKMKEYGFALWELLIIIVVLAVVGGIGAYVWTKKSEQKTTTTSSNTDTSQSGVKESSKTTPYFTIKEWGVRMPQTDVGDFMYEMSSDGKSAELKSKKLQSLGHGCQEGFIGRIYRLLPTDLVPSEGPHDITVEQVIKETPDIPHIGGFYYFVVSPQQTCAIENSDIVRDVANVQEQKYNEVQDAIKKIEAAK